MRFYQYSATDANGRPATGTIRATDADSAREALAKAGYQVAQVVDPGPQTAIQEQRALREAMQPRPLQAARTIAPPAPVVATARPTASAPIATAARSAPAEIPSSVRVKDPAPKAAVVTRKTAFGRDKDLFFLFSQLGQYYRAGVTPTTALHDLALKSPERYRGSLSEAEQAVGEGRTLSDVLETYPYLYSPDVVGTLRAGEISGYLAEACEQIGNQKESSHRLKRRLAYFLILFGMVVFAFPLSLSVVNGALQAIAEQDKAGGSLPPVRTLTHSVGVQLVHSLPWMIPLFVGFLAGLKFWHSMRMRDLRHRLVLVFPVLAGRAKAEAMARFTWALGMVSRGGASPYRTFQLAAESVPNLAIRARLLDAAGGMTESERLSSALHRSGTLPVEYTHIVETGETTGDVPRALADINRAVDADFRGRDATASTFVGIILYVAIAVVVVFLLAILYRMFYGGMTTTILGAD